MAELDSAHAMETPWMTHSYPKTFYDNQVNGSLRSAEVILGLIWQISQPRSVIDVGCGRGAWLAVAERLGANVLTGLDGEWVNAGDLLSANIQFLPTNLDSEFRIESQYDLCISMEVAEHLPESSARTFVEKLCALSRLVLFSAAVKGQGGTSHLNEQSQSYWIGLFREARYDCLDVIRPSIWRNDSVKCWYRQNTFLFHHPDYRFEETIRLPCGPKEYSDLIHPDLFLKRVMVQERPTLRWLAGRLRDYFRQKLPTSARS